MKAKRTLSLILAIAMLMSLLPTLTISAGAVEPHSLDYVFASNAFTATVADYTDIPKIPDRTLNREVSTGYWEFTTRRSMGFGIYSAVRRVQWEVLLRHRANFPSHSRYL